MLGRYVLPLRAEARVISLDEWRLRLRGDEPRISRQTRPVRRGGPTSTVPSDVRRAVTLARWLDRRGIDPLLGLALPGVGDAIAAGLGLYLVVVAIRHRMPAVVIARMLITLAFDTAVGAIPVVGDIFDWLYRSHTRNALLLQERFVARRSGFRDYAVVVAAALALILAVALPIAVLVWAVR